MAPDSNYRISGNIVDVVQRRIFPGTLFIEDGRISSVVEEEVDATNFILPGFIDAHVHIESSMLIPSEFARLAVVHGTVGTVSDPHEIANVLGMEGVEYMIRNGRKVPFKFYFGAPSCVPATPFESSGAVITTADIRELLKMDEIKYLSEMMNFPGVIFGDKTVMEKIQAAHEAGKVIDGHVPGLTGEDLSKYEAAGISTDHECFTMKEALEKIRLGMKILIREGSAARNFDELAGLLKTHPTKIMFCSDDKHPNDLIKGHINLLVKRALLAGYDLFDTLRAVTLNPKQHYKLDNGLLQVGDDADLCLVDNLTDLQVLQTYIRGVRLADNGKTLLESVREEPLNRFEADRVTARQLRIRATATHIKVIKATDGQLITGKLLRKARIIDGFAVADPEQDILKLVCMNRYQKREPAVAFIHGFGFREGAIASTVAHDSHNILAVGTNDDDLLHAIQLLIDSKGGISLANGIKRMVLPLPVAGIMTNADGYGMALRYDQLEAEAKKLGSSLASPFMTLSFMALLVIPELKLSDKGLFDGNTFGFTDLFS